jgi:hypothetical protein
MRNHVLGALLALFATLPAGAIGNRTALLNVQQECAAVGDIAYGAGQRWASCSVSRGRWVATIDLIDMYQAQYCLGTGQGESCEARALLLFGNRAYTPAAELLIQRIDAGDIDYDDPLVVKNEYGRLLALSARLPDGARSVSYFLWQGQRGKREGQWVAIDAQSWRKDLARKLPPGTVASEQPWPDIDTMSAQARLFSKEGAQPSAAYVELGLVGKRFVVKKIAVSESPE